MHEPNVNAMSRTSESGKCLLWPELSVSGWPAEAMVGIGSNRRTCLENEGFVMHVPRIGPYRGLNVWWLSS